MFLLDVGRIREFGRFGDIRGICYNYTPPYGLYPPCLLQPAAGEKNYKGFLSYLDLIMDYTPLVYDRSTTRGV